MNPMLDALTLILWSAAAFLSGALPFAVWLAGRRVRRVGDGNPGAANAWRVGGWRTGVAVLLFDFLKGALPVAAAHYGAHLTGWPLALIAVMPVAGHALSPFLRGRGGKALTVTFGIWAGLTLWQAPLALGVCMVLFYSVQRADAWSALLSMAGLLAYLLLTGAAPWLLGVWAANFLVLAWTHRAQLRQPPGLRHKTRQRVSGGRRP
jgi:acyl phosphate:glycerol-3-phosphate acyltransferase